MTRLKITLNGSSPAALASLADRHGLEFTFNDTWAEFSGVEDWTETIRIATEENPDGVCEVI